MFKIHFTIDNKWGYSGYDALNKIMMICDTMHPVDMAYVAAVIAHEFGHALHGDLAYSTALSASLGRVKRVNNRYLLQASGNGESNIKIAFKTLYQETRASRYAQTLFSINPNFDMLGTNTYRQWLKKDFGYSAKPKPLFPISNKRMIKYLRFVLQYKQDMKESQIGDRYPLAVDLLFATAKERLKEIRRAN